MRTALRLLALACMLACGAAARADYYVVVSADSALKTLTQKEAAEIFLGRGREHASGEFLLVFDMPRDSEARAGFYRAVAGMSLAQVNSHWARLMFTGRTLPPQPLPSEQRMHDLVKRNPSAIGYLQKEPADKALRTVLVVKDVQ